MSVIETGGLSAVHSSDRTERPDLRLLHYNDVYHVEPGSAEPVGGAARFQSVVNYYRSDPHFESQPGLLTLFSGDAFNPSLESTVTKGRHMVPFLNKAGTDVACMGNHDLDFGVSQFQHLSSQSKFPWLLANVLDPALGENVPIAHCGQTYMLTSSNGIKVGVVGLGEREWLETINSLPPGLIYKSASKTALELAPRLREAGADMVIALTHQREPNDNKLAESLPPGTVDIILGGHDHYYAHSVINGTHILRSGTDFKQLSYIEARRNDGDSPRWDFNIVRRDMIRDIPEDPDTVNLVTKLTSSLKAKLEKPIGYTVRPLDGRFTTVRQKESNLGNFVCDLMRFYYGADCAMMAGGTMRGDQVYPTGLIRLKDILNCFPFEDPVVLLRVRGDALLEALENGVSQLPKMEGRFTQVSNMAFGYLPSAPPGSRITWSKIDGKPIDPEKKYTLATRGYMGRGKDGFSSLLVESEGGQVEEIVDEESGVLISTILRQYFLSLRVMGRWQRWSSSMANHWENVHRGLHNSNRVKPPGPVSTPSTEKVPSRPQRRKSQSQRPGLQQRTSKSFYYGRFPEVIPAAENEETEEEEEEEEKEEDMMDSDSDSDPEILTTNKPVTNYVTGPARSTVEEECRMRLARQVLRKWMRQAGLRSEQLDALDQGEGEFEYTPAWTQGISPQIEGRIVIEGGEEN